MRGCHSIALSLVLISCSCGLRQSTTSSAVTPKISATLVLGDHVSSFGAVLELENRNSKDIPGWGTRSPVGLINVILEREMGDSWTLVDSHTFRPVIRVAVTQNPQIVAVNDIFPDVLAVGKSAVTEISVSIDHLVATDHEALFKGSRTPYSIAESGKYRVVFVHDDSKAMLGNCTFDLKVSKEGTVINRLTTWTSPTPLPLMQDDTKATQ